MPESPLTPLQAAEALANIAAHEEGLHARAGALTGVIWGLVSGAIFLSYGLAITSGDVPHWAFSVLWLPWTLVGVFGTVALWHMLALSRHQTPQPRIALAWVASSTVVFLLAILGLSLLDLEDKSFVYMTAVNALVAAGILVRISVTAGRLASWPLFLASLGMAGGAVSIGLADLSTAMAAFAAAGICCGSYAFAALATFMRG